MNIKNMDLNLLVLFKALATYRNVSKAASEVGLSQPAMSHALNRLRETFEDELFIRTPKGMIPTEKALYLESIISVKLDELEKGMFSGEGFDPGSSTRKFRLCGTDLNNLSFLPRLMKLLKSDAPLVNIQTLPPDESTFFENMESGKVDLSIGVEVPRRANFLYETIFQDDHVGVTRKSNLNIDARVSLKSFANSEHLLVAPLGGENGPIDKLLEAQDLSRRKSVITTQFGDVPWLLLERDLIVCLPRSTAKKFCSILPLKMFKLPVKMDDIKVEMVWHARTNSSEAHQWLRQLTRDNFTL